ncbi:MAG: multiheme c-type cytochrome [Bradymonadia bacterium]
MHVWMLVWVLMAPSPGGPSAGFFSKGVTPIDTGITAAQGGISAFRAAECRTCHEEIYDEWSRSRHHLSWTNGIFQLEYQQQPRAWCVNCHAPLMEQVAQVNAGGGELADEGITCVACHVRAGRMTARRQRPGSIHETQVDPNFGNPDFCGGCHQFNFPIFGDKGEALSFTEHPMQRTLTQFQAGPHAQSADGCRTCHSATPAQHLYPGAHSPAMLDKALELVFCRPAPGRLRVGVHNVGAGHNVPTGDVHRHMNARVWRSTAPEAMFEVFVGRRFEVDPKGGKRTTWDSTLPPGKLRRFDFNESKIKGRPDEPINVELRYVYGIEEWPRHGHDPGEPMSHIVEEGRMLPSAVPPCPTETR